MLFVEVEEVPQYPEDKFGLIIVGILDSVECDDSGNKIVVMFDYDDHVNDNDNDCVDNDTKGSQLNGNCDKLAVIEMVSTQC